MKYSYAKKYFNAKQYSKSATLLVNWLQSLKEQLMPRSPCTCWRKAITVQKGLSKTASQYFETYYTTYPKGEVYGIIPFLFRLWFVSGLSGSPVRTSRRRIRRSSSCNFIWSIIRKVNGPRKRRTSCSSFRRSWLTRN